MSKSLSDLDQLFTIIPISSLNDRSNLRSIPDDDFGVIIDLKSYEDHKFDPFKLDNDSFKKLKDLLYRNSLVIWRGVELNPQQQYHLTKLFDPSSDSYGHKNKNSKIESKSILHPDLKTLPDQPQVQLIGNGKVIDPEVAPGIDPLPTLKHPHHKTFHKDVVSQEDEEKGVTRFYRWHIDAALYDLNPPKVTTLQALRVPQGPKQICRYDDGTGDQLTVPLGTTAFVSGKKMFEILSPELKSLAVRTKVQYAPHPYVWMSNAKAKSNGLGIEVENKELPRDQLPSFEESKIKTFPLLWKNPVTGNLHLQVHPCGAEKLIIEPLPKSSKFYSSNDGDQESYKIDDDRTLLFRDGRTIEDLKTVREILYKLQRPGISPDLVYCHDWKEKDLCLFHNRGVLHTVVGAFKEDQHRAFWQCNMASSDEPLGPDTDDLQRFV
ncbi:taurine catabolism dioxygenase [Phakopsora pachyrhizi]|uniref:Taurine catabolism dioxygenase n=1 Tax=Phakopsora pachyrhizi TaxID=170000 RepID=A0AAV0AEV3_PHAPC|nr:taurine catabolism dioxygenase [Phakopsora pachyrhizi]